jgi:hypothetical protein
MLCIKKIVKDRNSCRSTFGLQEMADKLKDQKGFSNMTHRVDYTNVQTIPSNKLTNFYDVLKSRHSTWIAFLFEHSVLTDSVCTAQ